MDSANEFQVGALTCKSTKMNARQQFHLARRLGPILSPVIAEIGKMDDASNEEELMKLVPLIANALADGDDSKFDYVLDACLSHILVKQDGGGWAALRKNGVDMYPLEMFDMLQIVGRAIMQNLASFTVALPEDGKLAGLIRTYQGSHG